MTYDQCKKHQAAYLEAASEWARLTGRTRGPEGIGYQYPINPPAKLEVASENQEMADEAFGRMMEEMQKLAECQE